MSATASVSAPFSSGGEYEVDAEIAQRLLGHALEGGGDYADLFFEYRISANYVYEEGRVKTVVKSVRRSAPPMQQLVGIARGPRSTTSTCTPSGSRTRTQWSVGQQT